MRRPRAECTTAVAPRRGTAAAPATPNPEPAGATHASFRRALLGRPHRVLEEHRDRHGTHAARDRRDLRCTHARALEVDIAHETRAALRGCIRDAIDPH